MKLFKVLSILVIAMLMVAGFAKPVLAWECVNYNFRILEDGTVQVQNMSAANEPAQTAKVYIDGVLVTSVSAPALAAGTDWTTIGSVTVPSVAYTWQVQGDSDCGDSGSYTPPTYCEVTTQDDPVWNGWVVAADGLSRTRTGTIAIWDAVDPTHSCGSQPISQTEYLYCLANGTTTGWYPDGQAPNGATKGTCPVPPVDVCPNLDGVQETVPEGMIIDSKGDCVKPVIPPEPREYVDLCFEGTTYLHIWTARLESFPNYTPGTCKIVPVTGGGLPSPLFILWQNFLSLFKWGWGLLN